MGTEGSVSLEDTEEEPHEGNGRKSRRPLNDNTLTFARGTRETFRVYLIFHNTPDEFTHGYLAKSPGSCP